jgi:hypothetical protein
MQLTTIAARVWRGCDISYATPRLVMYVCLPLSAVQLMSRDVDEEGASGAAQGCEVAGVGIPLGVFSDGALGVRLFHSSLGSFIDCCAGRGEGEQEGDNKR